MMKTKYATYKYVDAAQQTRARPFQRGVKGKGGMPPDFRVEDHGPRQLRVTTLHGLVFGTFSDETPAIENFIGLEVLARFDRVGDLFEDVLKRPQRMEEAVEKLASR